MKVNWNKVAREVAYREGGKQQVSIAQIKEIIRCTAEVLFIDLQYRDWEVLEGLDRLLDKLNIKWR